MSDKIDLYAINVQGAVHRTGVLERTGAIVSLLPPDAGSRPVSEGFSDISTQDYQPWGESNNLPTEWRLKAEKSTKAYPLIAKSVGMIYGRGLTYWIETTNADGSLNKDFTKNPEIDLFLRNNFCNFLMQQRAMDLFLPGNMFCEFILSKGLNKIVGLSHKEAEFTRFGKIREDKSGFDFVRYTGDWSKPSEATPIPFLNREEFDPEFIKKEFKAQKKFVWHSHLPSPGRTIYAWPPHGGLYRKDGWLDFANSVPELMNNINKNAANIRYHIKIPYMYWEQAVENWKGLEKKNQDAIINEKLTELDTFLSGSDNVGKSFYSHFATDTITGKPINGWDIIELNDPIKADKYLTSVEQADIQTASAYSIDSSLSGVQISGAMSGAGSGSDKRVGFENSVNTSYWYSEAITEPLNLVAWFNGWDQNLKFGFIHDIPTSLNENKSGTKTQV
jgi:hypothetical protein